MRVCSLASGSAGNAYVVESQGKVLLIDCGLSCSTLERRLAAVELLPTSLVAVVLTHNHIDHAKGLHTFRGRYPQVPLFANELTAETIAWEQKMDALDFVPFENGQAFEVGPFSLQAFSVPHDVPDPVGFRVETEGLVYFHATDFGTPLASLGAYLGEADVATVESNHDATLLCASARPLSVKQRIAGARGHLSNAEAAWFVQQFASSRLRHLFLAHLSRSCNAPHLVEQAFAEALGSSSLRQLRREIVAQDQVSHVWWSEESYA